MGWGDADPGTTMVPMPLRGTLLTICSSLFAAFLLVLYTLLVPLPRRLAQNEALSAVYAQVGVVYAVVLAMVVIGVWDARKRAHSNTYAETSALLQVFWYGQALRGESGTWITTLAEQYTRSVVDTEWQLLAEGRSSPQVWKQYIELRRSINEHEPLTAGDEGRYQVALQAIAQLGDARRERVNEAAQGTVPGLLWAALVLGAVVNVGFTFLFDMQSLWLHATVVFLLSTVIGFLMLLAAELNRPFSGPVRVNPTAFELALERMGAMS